MTLEEQHQLLLTCCENYQTYLQNQPTCYWATSKDQKIQKLKKTSAISELIEALSVETNSPELIEQAINDFKVKFSTAKPILSEHRDSDTILFLKNVGFSLSSMVLGLGLAISYTRKNSCKFWQSNGEILCNSLTKVIDTKLTDDSLQPSSC